MTAKRKHRKKSVGNVVKRLATTHTITPKIRPQNVWRSHDGRIPRGKDSSSPTDPISRERYLDIRLDRVPREQLKREQDKMAYLACARGDITVGEYNRRVRG